MTGFIPQFQYLTNTSQGVRHKIRLYAIEGNGYVCTSVCMRVSVSVTVDMCWRVVWYARTHVRAR